MRVRFTLIALMMVPTLSALPAFADPPIADPQPSAGVEGATGTEVCGHVGEMNAARTALQEDRREDALRHLKEARRILAACDARLAMESEEEMPALSI
jgi:hypothetical protein